MKWLECAEEKWTFRSYLFCAACESPTAVIVDLGHTGRRRLVRRIKELAEECRMGLQDHGVHLELSLKDLKTNVSGYCWSDEHDRCGVAGAACLAAHLNVSGDPGD